jgi:hypothetical protein
MKKAEITLLVLTLIGIVCNLLLVPGGVVFTLISLFLYSSIYFYFGFAFFNGISLRKLFKPQSYQGISALRIVGAIATGFSLSMVLIGILFKLLSWPGAFINMAFGLACTLVVIIISLIKYYNQKSVYYQRILIRCFALFFVGLFLISLPKYAIVSFKYRNHQNYLNAFIAFNNNPDNEELHQKLDEERMKMERGE